VTRREEEDRRVETHDGERAPSSAERVIVVLGCPPVLHDGRPNPFFLGRIEAALALHREAPHAPILCSGGIDDRGRDEARWIAEALRRRGVPGERLEVDSASSRTRHSIDAAIRLHPDRPLVFVSQPFHLPRVLRLARRRGCEARSHPAPGPRPSPSLRIRETLARWRAWIEG
jgi:SanA protein